MQIEIYMKSPDSLYNALIENIDDIDERRRIERICFKWFKWDEYVTLIVDTEKETIKVKELF